MVNASLRDDTATPRGLNLCIQLAQASLVHRAKSQIFTRAPVVTFSASHEKLNVLPQLSAVENDSGAAENVLCEAWRSF